MRVAARAGCAQPVHPCGGAKGGGCWGELTVLCGVPVGSNAGIPFLKAWQACRRATLG